MTEQSVCQFEVELRRLYEIEETDATWDDLEAHVDVCSSCKVLDDRYNNDCPHEERVQQTYCSFDQDDQQWLAQHTSVNGCLSCIALIKAWKIGEVTPLVMIVCDWLDVLAILRGCPSPEVYQDRRPTDPHLRHAFHCKMCSRIRGQVMNKQLHQDSGH